MIYIQFVVELLILLLLLYLARRVKNWAEIDDARDKEYETAKGKNLATKEDIEGITTQIERVKSEISFESQQKKEFVVERKKHLSSIFFIMLRRFNMLRLVCSFMGGIIMMQANFTCLMMS